MICTLIIVSLLVANVPLVDNFTILDEINENAIMFKTLDLNNLVAKYGDEIPLVVRFIEGHSMDLSVFLSEIGLDFTLGTIMNSHVGPYYLLTGSASEFRELLDMDFVLEIAPQTFPQFLESPRDVSIPEINADDVWNTLDDYGMNITGTDILIADLDSGVDWRHPDLWFADGGSYTYVNSTSTGFVNGSDAVDLNNDYSLSPDEVLYSLDLNDDNIFQIETDWLWVDNVTQNAFPDVGEPFFVVNDTNVNSVLDGDDILVMLGTPKTKYIVEMDGDSHSPSLQVWDRNQNLTISNHKDTSLNGGGHGTAVASILLGGQLGYRKWVGVAPSAELMMIRVIGDENTTLSIEAGLSYANATGAEVILTEIGSWTYHYLDGSSLAEQMIDELVSDGIPVISPSGNLGGKQKHCLFNAVPSTPYYVDWILPTADGVEVPEDINEVYITVLSIDPTDFQSCNFSLVMDRSSFPNFTITIYLHPGLGYLNFRAETGTTNFIVESFISTSSRGTSMLGIWIHGILPTITLPPFHKLNVTAPDPTLFHGYISDEESSWTGGAIWVSDMSNDYEITWPSTADSAISVASYNTRYGIIGDLASYSSRGPRIDGVVKQSIGAPGGFDIISAYSNGSVWLSWYNGGGSLPFNMQFGSYRLFSGTSAAGPHVAGCAALMLQADPNAGSFVKSIIESTARNDTYTGTVPNTLWGAGKLDVNTAVGVLLADTDPPLFGIHTRDPSTPNATQSVTITVGVTDESGVDTVILSYFNGTVWINVTMTFTGSYYEGLIPAFPNETSVDYLMYANDTVGNWAMTSTFDYVVCTTTPSTTTTTTTTITPPNDSELDYLRLALLLTIVLAFVIFMVLYSRRRSR